MQTTTIPFRLQRSRRKGALLVSPDYRDYVCCTRPGEFGNKFKVGGVGVPDVATSLRLYRGSIQGLMRARMHSLLSNKHLACYCKLCDEHKSGKPLNVKCDKCQPCHVDVIGEILYGKAQ